MTGTESFRDIERADLSAPGAERRRRILELALGEQRARVRRRRAMRAGAALGVICIAAAGVRFGATRPTMPAAGGTPERVAVAAPRTPSHPIVEIVRTSANALERATAGVEGGRVEVIGDAELLDLLRQQGYSVGLLRTQGNARLVGDFEPREAEIEEPASG